MHEWILGEQHSLISKAETLISMAIMIFIAAFLHTWQGLTSLIPHTNSLACKGLNNCPLEQISCQNFEVEPESRFSESQHFGLFKFYSVYLMPVSRQVHPKRAPDIVSQALLPLVPSKYPLQQPEQTPPFLSLHSLPPRLTPAYSSFSECSLLHACPKSHWPPTKSLTDSLLCKVALFYFLGCCIYSSDGNSNFLVIVIIWILVSSYSPS